MKTTQFVFALLMHASTAWAGLREEVEAAAYRKDYATMLRLTLPLAAQGHAQAQYNLGQMNSEGLGMVQDYVEAVKWFRRAAAQGYAPAQYNLGVMYGRGEGVPVSYVRAHLWLNLAAVKSYADAVESRDIVASKMTPRQIGEAQKLARECQARNFKGCD